MSRPVRWQHPDHSTKLIEKKREGARVKKRYDRAQTPYQRIIASGYLTKRKTERLVSLYWKLDPVTLRKELEQRQDHFWTFGNGQRELEGNDSPREMDAIVRKYLVEITASQEPRAPDLEEDNKHVSEQTPPARRHRRAGRVKNQAARARVAWSRGRRESATPAPSAASARTGPR